MWRDGFRQAIECRVFRVRFNYLKCEVGSDLAEVVFDGGENALLLIMGVLSDEQAHTSRSDDAD